MKYTEQFFSLLSTYFKHFPINIVISTPISETKPFESHEIIFKNGVKNKPDTEKKTKSNTPLTFCELFQLVTALDLSQEDYKELRDYFPQQMMSLSEHQKNYDKLIQLIFENRLLCSVSMKNEPKGLIWDLEKLVKLIFLDDSVLIPFIHNIKSVYEKQQSTVNKSPLKAKYYKHSNLYCLESEKIFSLISKLILLLDFYFLFLFLSFFDTSQTVIKDNLLQQKWT